MFRRLQTMLFQVSELSLDHREDPRGIAANLQRLASMFLNELHGHHLIEDIHYFPMLARLEPRLERGFALLDSDHHALDPHLHGLAERIIAVLRALPQANAKMSRLHGELAQPNVSSIATTPTRRRSSFP